MKTKRSTTLVIEYIERLNSSANGNPRFRFFFTNGSQADSQSDASYCYAIGNEGLRKGDRVKMTWTRAGRIATMEPAPLEDIAA